MIGRQEGETMHIDTWLMSCRVQSRLEGIYRPTPKNGMVREFYLKMGFNLVYRDETSTRYELPIEHYQPRPTRIKIVRRAYEPI